MPDTTCTVSGCSNTNIAAHGICSKHYGRWKRYGSSDAPTCRAPFCNKRALLANRTWCRYHLDHATERAIGPAHMPGAIRNADLIMLMSCCETDQCVVWPRYCNPQTGYGQIGNNKTAHRESCRLHHGEPPDDRNYALHSCNNRPCFNPRHLRWGTQQENVDDRQRDGVWHEAMKNVTGRPAVDPGIES